MIIQTLWHFYGFVPGDVLNAETHHAKFIGAYRRDDEAAAAIGRVAGQPGFRDFPDGFRLFPFEVDRTYWSDGFLPNPGGDDLAVAGDGSGIFGTDEALAENFGDTSRNLEREEEFIAAKPKPDRPDELWELSHYKISRENGQAFEDMGYKLIGFYSTRAQLDAAIRRLARKSGFQDHPQGFRIRWTSLGAIHWEEGFA